MASLLQVFYLLVSFESYLLETDNLSVLLEDLKVLAPPEGDTVHGLGDDGRLAETCEKARTY